MLASTVQFSRNGQHHRPPSRIRGRRPQPATRRPGHLKCPFPQDPTACPEPFPAACPRSATPQRGNVLTGRQLAREPNSQRSTRKHGRGRERSSRLAPLLLRKEVIQPHLPVRLPCYDFVPIADPTFDSSLPYGLGRRLRVLPTFVT